MEDSQFMTVAEVAAELNVNETTLYNWLRVGTLRGYRMGALWRVARVDLDAFIAAGRNVPTQAPEVVTHDNLDIY